MWRGAFLRSLLATAVLTSVPCIRCIFGYVSITHLICTSGQALNDAKKEAKKSKEEIICRCMR